MDKITIYRLETLPGRIDSKRAQAARIRDRLTDPAHAAINADGGKYYHDVRRREIELAENIDKANEIDHEADELQKELDELRDALMQYLADNPPKHTRTGLNDYETKATVKCRLVWGCDWSETAELVGLCRKTCQSKYERWLQTF